MAHQILVRIDVDEEYKDVDPQIAADDYMEGSKAYGWGVITERVYTHSEVEAILRDFRRAKDDPGHFIKRNPHWWIGDWEKAAQEEVEPRDATIAELRAEVEEQARLLGAGGSREAALMAEVERLKKVAQVACDALALIGVMDEHSGHLCEAISHSKDMLHEGYQPCPGIRMINSALSLLAENGITPSK